MIKVNIVFGAEDNVKSTNIQLSEDITIKDLISRSINIFNEQLIKNASTIRLNNYHDKYALKASKKNGRPKLDLPSKYMIY
jgi:hypothetical protein